MTEHRVLSLLPPYLQTDNNRRDMAVVDDVLFEPASVEQLMGQIGSRDGVSQIDIDTDPFIPTKYITDDQQLSPTVVSKKDNGDIDTGVFYDDIINHLAANGANVSQVSRLFDTPYFVFSIPIDIDMWSNFQRYYWTGPGTSTTLAEYITKDAVYSQTVLYKPNGSGGWTKVTPTYHHGTLPGSATVGDVLEHVTAPGRPIKQWTVSGWSTLLCTILDQLPADSTGYNVSTYVYVTRYGSEYQRPSFVVWSETAERWVTKQAIVSKTRPNTVFEGTIWEDASSGIDRVYYRFNGLEWEPLTYEATQITAELGVPGAFAQTTYLIAPVTRPDKWIDTNWWRHYDDLSAVDQVAYKTSQAFRPIISLWSSIETLNDTKSERHQAPLFETYSFSAEDGIVPTKTLTPVYNGSSIFTYKRGPGATDAVLGFTPIYDERGEIEFDLTLESQTYPFAPEPIVGYRFFKDLATGKYWSVWMRAPEALQFDPAMDAVPRNFSHNPDHLVLTNLSRSTLIDHYANIISTSSTGVALGSNGYRWSDRNPISGANIIDTEGSLLKIAFSLTDPDYDIMEAFREASRHYSRFHKRFARIMTQLWNNGQNSNPNGTLIAGLTASQFVDRVITNMFADIDIDRPYSASGMGTYMNEITGVLTNICCPPSPARLGLTPTYEPLIFVDRQKTRILCHDGRIIDAFDDDRDDVVLALENRFFQMVPEKRRLETVDDSAWIDENSFSIKRFVSGRTYSETIPRVNEVVDDYTDLTPSSPTTVYSRQHASVAQYVSGQWIVKPSGTGTFFSIDDDAYFVVNDFSAHEILPCIRWDADYTFDEYYAVLYREFDRWRISRQLDPSLNDQYSANDRFTWNYTSSGHEGNYRGIYLRVYGTDRPHCCPWEIVGFSIKPAWWDDAYTADSVDEDGLGRYESTNAMWDDLQTGDILTTYVDLPSKYLMPTDAPVPVDENGDLIDPITSGMISQEAVIGADAAWRYGDGSPVEVQFHESPEGVYAQAMAAYLLKPARTVDRLWADFMFSIGGDNFQSKKFLVDNSTYRRAPASVYDVHGLNGEVNPGIGALVTEKLMLQGKSVSTYAQRLRSSAVTLGWRTEGFVDQKNTRLTTISGVDIPEEDLFCVLHKSQPVAVETHSGVYIVKIGSKYQVFGYDFSAPYFTVDVPEVPIRGGQVIRDQKFFVTDPNTVQYTLTDYSVGIGEEDRFYVLLNGDRIDAFKITLENARTFILSDVVLQSGDVLTARLHTTTSNSSTRVRSFQINEYVYTFNDTSSGKTREVYYGSEMNNENDVIQFLTDYGRYLTKRGWVYKDQNWTDTAKRFALWAQNADDLEIFIDCPSAKALEYVVPHGHVDNLKSHQFGGGSALDLSMAPADGLSIIRFDDRVSILSTDGVYLVRLPIVRYQHVMFMSAVTRFNDIVYDAFTGTHHNRLFVDTIRIKDWDGRLKTPGFILSEDGMNMNFETAAKELAGAYDTTPGTVGSINRKQALELYNFAVKEYMTQFNIDLKTSFDYHKRAMREKGTKRSLMAFARVKREATPLDIIECWAWHIGSFGFHVPSRFTATINTADIKTRRAVISFGDTENGDYAGPLFSDPNDTDWVLPPTNEEFTFGTVSADVDVSLVIHDDVAPFEQYYEWDPANGKHEPIAYKEIDIESSVDPAFYTTSPNTSRVNADAWGDAELGTVWWNTSNRRYSDYKAGATREVQSQNWGKLRYLPVSGITTLDYGYSARTDTPHAFFVNDVFDMVTKTGVTYEAIVLSIPTSTTFAFALMEGPESASILVNGPVASDFSDIVLGSVDVYEWIKSSLSPVQYPPSLGVPLNAENPSWVEKMVNGTPVYYFWAKNVTTPGSKHPLSVNVIADRLRNPSSVMSPWFARLDDDSIVMDTAPCENRDTIDIEFVFTPRNDRIHNEWLIIPEGYDNTPVDASVKSKLYESMVGYDVNGRDIPGLLVPDRLAIGNKDHQTVFPDQAQARSIFLNVLNEGLKRLNRYASPFFDRAFPASASFWEYANYDTHGRTVSEHVLNVTQRDSLVGVIEGDCVIIDQVRMIDGVYRTETHQNINDVWVVVQAELGTAEVNDAIFDDFYRNMITIETYIGTPMLNSLLMALLYEMLRQNKKCDWTFKTSFVDIKLTLDTGQPTTTSRDEYTIIHRNVEEYKPFHTKVRRFVTSHRLLSGDNPYDLADVVIEDTNVLKSTIHADRLSCNLFDEHVLGVEPIGSAGLDYPSWQYTNLGSDEWDVVDTFISQPGVRLYDIRKLRSHASYRVMGYTSAGDSAPVPTYKLQFNPLGTVVRFDSNPPAALVFEVQMAKTVVSDQLVDTVTNVEPLGPSKSTFSHAAVLNQPRVSGVHNSRTVSTGVCSDFAGCGDCLADDGGGSEERVRTEVLDMLTIKATTHHTPLYGGLAGSPLNYLPLDRQFGGHEPKMFYAVTNVAGTTQVTTQDLVSSTSVTLTEAMVRQPLFVATSPQYTITDVKYTVDSVTRVLDKSEWELVNDQSVRITTPLTAGGAIRLMYGRIKLLSEHCNFTNYNLGHDVTIRDRDTIEFDVIPPDAGTVTVVYTNGDAVDPTPNRAAFARHQYIVDEVLADHGVRNDSYNNVLVNGYRVFNTTTESVWEWNGSTWSETDLPSGTYFFNRVGQELRLFTTSSAVTLEVAEGDAGTMTDAAMSQSVSACYGPEATTDYPKSVMAAHRLGASVSSLICLFSDSTAREVDSSTGALISWKDCVTGKVLTSYGSATATSQEPGTAYKAGVRLAGVTLSGIRSTSISDVAPVFDTGGVIIVGFTAVSIANAATQTIVRLGATVNYEVQIVGVGSNQYTLAFTFRYANGSQHRMTAGPFNGEEAVYARFQYNATTQQFVGSNSKNLPFSTVLTPTDTAFTTPNATLYVGNNAQSGVSVFNGIIHLLGWGRITDDTTQQIPFDWSNG